MPFISFSCLVALVRTWSTTLNSIGKSGYHLLFLVLGVKVFTTEYGVSRFFINTLLQTERLWPLQLSCWNLIPSVSVLAGGGFRRWLGHEDRALVNGISVLTKEIPESWLAPSTVWRYNKNVPSMNQETGPHQTQNLVPRSQTSDLQNNEK